MLFFVDADGSMRSFLKDPVKKKIVVADLVIAVHNQTKKNIVEFILGCLH